MVLEMNLIKVPQKIISFSKDKIKNFISFIVTQKPSFYGTAYLLIIPIFAIIYTFCPGLKIELKFQGNYFLQAFYFSIVTITTLGYGDITPVNNIAQFFVALEALLGVISIGLFLNSLSLQLSSLSQQEEKRKDEEKRYLDDVIKLEGYNRLVEMNIERYLAYTHDVTTPLSKRTGTKLNEEFTFNDMQDLFKGTLKMSDNFFKPAISYYFESQTELEKSVKELVCNININNWPELEEACINFLKLCKSLDFKEYILSQPLTRMGDKKGSEFDEQMIKEHTGEVKFLKSNSINAYIATFMLIKHILFFIKCYRNEIIQITKKNDLEDKVEQAK
jgi:hypothetical protein